MIWRVQPCRVVRAYDHGAPDVLNLEQALLPEPVTDQVLIRLKAAGHGRGRITLQIDHQ